MSVVALAVGISTLTWLVAAVIVMPGVWRRLRNQPKSLDDLWVLGFFMIATRVALQFASYSHTDDLSAWSNLTSASVAVAFIIVVRGYQRDDT